MDKEKLYVWSCDYSSKSGEGNLARLFTKKLSNHYNLSIIRTNNTIFNYKIFNYKYVSPFVGIICCWYYYLLKKNISYLNYLPLWNFILFFFLPPKTIFGPITGGSNFKNKNNIVRNFLFPIFYRLSSMALEFRDCEIFFSTDLLKKFLSKNVVKRANFNFILRAYSKKKKLKKNIDFIVYYREHINKKKFFPKNLLNELVKRNYKVHSVGDRLEIKGVKNHGRVSQKKINYLLSKAKYSIGSGESLYTFFTIECLNNNVKVFIDKNYNFKITRFKNSFLEVNFNSKQIFKYL